MKIRNFKLRKGFFHIFFLMVIFVISGMVCVEACDNGDPEGGGNEGGGDDEGSSCGNEITYDSWGSCSKPCGGGTQSRWVSLYNSCNGESSGWWENQACNTQPCCVPDCSHTMEHCSGTTYGDGCGGECGGGINPDCDDENHCSGYYYTSNNGCGQCWGTEDCSDPTCTLTGCSACIGESCWDGCQWISGTEDCSDPICEVTCNNIHQPGCMESEPSYSYETDDECCDSSKKCYECTSPYSWDPTNEKCVVCEKNCSTESTGPGCISGDLGHANEVSDSECCGGERCYQCDSGYVWDSATSKCVSTNNGRWIEVKPN